MARPLYVGFSGCCGLRLGLKLVNNTLWPGVRTHSHVLLQCLDGVSQFLVLLLQQLVLVFGLFLFLASCVSAPLGGGIVFLSSLPVLLVLNDAAIGGAAHLVARRAVRTEAIAARRARRLDAEVNGLIVVHFHVSEGVCVYVSVCAGACA